MQPLDYEKPDLRSQYIDDPNLPAYKRFPRSVFIAKVCVVAAITVTILIALVARKLFLLGW